MTLLVTRRGRRGLLVTVTAAAALLAGALTAAAAQEPATPASPANPAPADKAAKPGAAKSGAAKEGAVSQKDAASYSLGVIMGEQLRAGGVKPESLSTARIAAGVHDALTGKHATTESDRQNMVNFLRTAQESMVDTNHRAAAKFLGDNAKKPGVVTTTSGLQYKVMTGGSGDSPKRSDQVTVNYRGRLLDGTEFDSSYKRGEPATFEVDRVIPGWTEALQLMKPGAKYELYVPPQLAYDQRSRPPIPPGSMLIFEVELLSVKPATTPAQPAPSTPPEGAAPKPEGAAPKQ